MLNKSLIMGNLCADPELHYTASGNAVTELRLASNRKYKAGNETKEETCFVQVTVWGKRAENCCKYLKKGSPVFVEGRLQSGKYEKNGQTHFTLKITAEYVQFLNRPEEGTKNEAKLAQDDNIDGWLDDEESTV